MLTTDLPGDALEYVAGQLQLAETSFHGLLAERLRKLDLGVPFALLGPDQASPAPDLESGLLGAHESDRLFAAAVGHWLNRGEAERVRMMVLEEPLGKKGDPAVARADHDSETRVYWAAKAGATVEDVSMRVRCLSGYPGVGVLSRPPPKTAAAQSWESADLDELARCAVAVLVRAWDDEAFVIAPVEDRLRPQELELS